MKEGTYSMKHRLNVKNSILWVGIMLIFMLTSWQSNGQNYAVSCDGSGDYVSTQISRSGLSTFSICTWYRYDGSTGSTYRPILGSSTGNFFIGKHTGNTNIGVQDGNYISNIASGTDAWDGNWHHITYTYNGSYGRVYLDGVYVGGGSFSGGSGNLYFGRESTSYHWHGLLDEVRIYDFLMDEVEIESQMYSEISGNELGLLGYWNMNESTGMIVPDLSAYNNDGTLVGDAVFISSNSPVLPNNSTLLPFAPVDPTGLPYSIVVGNVTIDGVNLPDGASIAVYDGSLCVGASFHNGSGNTQIISWEGDAQQGLSGFTAGNGISVKVRTKWFSEMQIFNATPTFTVGNGNYGYGSFSVMTLNITTGLSPDVALSHNSINFNAVPVNSTVSDTVIISNNGTAILAVLSVVSSSANFTYTLGNYSLNAASSDTLIISFTPGAVSTYSETITINTDHPTLNSLVINLYGSGLPVPTPSMTATPSFINFGGIAVGDSASIPFYINNGGNGTLNITGVSSNSSSFVVNGATSFSLGQNTNQEIVIDFIPLSMGAHSGLISISSNNGNLSIPLSGTAGTGHFSSVPPNGNAYNVIVENVMIDNFNLNIGDEIAVFDDTTCVGVGFAEAGGSSLILDGSGDYTSATMNVSENNYTAEMWFKSNSTNGGLYSVQGGGHDRHIYLNNGNICTRVYSNETICTSGQNYGDGNWHHVAHVYGGSQGGQKIYVDGILKAQGNKSFSNFTSQSSIYIGYSNDKGYFNGVIDEVRIWNIAKSQVEILTAMNTSIPPGAGLLAYFRFDGFSAIDISGNGHILNFHGNSTFSPEGALLSDAIQIVCWEENTAPAYSGFTPGNPMSFKIWGNVFNTNLEMTATPSYTIGNGNFSYAPFTVADLTALSGLDPIVEYSTSNLYVGQVEMNQSVTDSFYVYNWGNAPVNINLSETSSVFSLVYGSSSIAAGDSLKVEVTFSPTSSGNHTTVVTAITNDPDALQTEIQLEGFALPVGTTDITVTPSSLQFNGVVIGDTSTLTFNVINIGTAPLTVSSIVSNSSVFTASPGSFTLNNTNDNQLVTVSFSPGDKGVANGFLTINSNTSAVHIDLFGVGYEGHFAAVDETGLPYTIIINDHNLGSELEVGDEIGVFDNGLCVGSSPIMPNGNSLYLDGSGDYVNVPDDPSIDLGNQATLEAWVKFSSIPSFATFLSMDEGSGTTDKWVFGYSNNYNGSYALSVHINGINGSTWLNSNTWNPGLNTWYHVALTKNMDTYRFYIDGQFYGEVSSSIGIPVINYDMQFGRAEGSFHHNGYMDEVRVWSTVRTQSELQDNSGNFLTGTEFGLEGYWNFDGSVMDITANNNDGTLYGNAHILGEQVPALQNKNIQVTVWEKDVSLGLQGYTPGNNIEIKAWLQINSFGSELDGTASYIVGDGTFGYGIYSVCNILFDLPQIAIDPLLLFEALNEPDSSQQEVVVTNNGTEDLFYSVLPSEFNSLSSLHVDGNGDYANTGTWNAGSTWTIQAWVKPSALPSGRKTIMGGFASCLDWGISLYNGSYAVAITPPSGCSGSYLNPTQAVVGEWALVTGTNDGTTANLYVNGVLVASGPVQSNYGGVNTSIRIGGESCCGSNNFPGLIDELQVWNYPRSQAEIQQGMFSPLEGTETGLLGYWNFNDGTLNDLSGNGHNGSFAGNAFVGTPSAPVQGGWLSYNIATDTLTPGSSDTVQFNFNSSGLIDGMYSAFVSFESNDVNTPLINLPVTLNVTGNAQIAASADTLDFGEIIVGNNLTIDFDIQNIGTDSLHISSLNILNGPVTGMSLLTAWTFPYSIPPLQSETLSVKFEPTTDGPRVDSLIIISDASNEDSLLVSLLGNGLTPADIEVSMLSWTDTMNSGEVLVDTFYIYNYGQAALQYNLANSIPWLSLNPAAGSVAVGDSVAITMNISTFGVYANTYSGSFQINSNDLIDPSLSFSMNLLVYGTPEIYGPVSLDFGIVNVNETGLANYLLQNIGTDTLQIGTIIISNPVFVSSSYGNFNIPPGQSVTLNLQFLPLLDFSYSGIISIPSNSPTTPIYSVALHGTGLLPPDISFSDDTITVIDNVLASTTIYPATMANVGGQTLTYSISLDNPAGKALNLDGNGDYLNIVNSSTLNPDTAMTIEAWINPQNNNQEFIVAKEYSGVGTYRLFINSSGKLQFQLNNSKSVISNSSISINTWTHVAASTNGEHMQVFINGVLDNEIVYSGFTISANTFNLRLGRSYYNEYFNGQMDELRIWGVYKNNSEIAAYMNQTLSGSEPGLILYYAFDGSGNIEYDVSTSGNNGTLYGNASRVTSNVVLNDFLSISPLSGSMASGPDLINLTFMTDGLAARIYERRIFISSNDPYDPLLEIPVFFDVGAPANIAAYPLSPFDDTYIGQSDTLDLVLLNTGAGIIDITSIVFSNTDFSFDFHYPFIYPYSEKRIKVFYTPSSGGAVSEIVSINNSSPNAPLMVIPLSATGLEPPIVSTNEPSFSQTLNYGSLIGQELKIYNDGDGPLNWDLSGAVPAWLTLSISTGVVSAHDSVIVTLSFNGVNDGGSYQTNLLLNSNDYNNPQLIIPVSLYINGAIAGLPITSLSNYVTYQATEVDTFYLNNTGLGPLDYTLIESVNWLSLSSTSGSVAIGDVDTIIVTYDGNFPHGNYQTTIDITTNDPNQTSLAVTVSLDILHATLVSIPTSLSFGYSVVNIGESKNLTILNNGNVDLTIDSIYSVDPFSPQTTANTFLGAGQSIVVPVYFLPNATLIFNETIYIATNIGIFSVPVHGIGENPYAAWSYSWNMWDYGLTDVATGASKTLYIHNIGNIPWTMDDFDMSEEHFDVSDSIFTLNPGQTKAIQVTFNPTAVAIYESTMLFTSNSIGTKEILLDGRGFFLSQSPVLTYVDDTYYNGINGVYPLLGSTSTYFEYKVIYTDPDNNPPMIGYPIVGIDKNGDGDFLDSGEDEFEMAETDFSDVNFADGKTYQFITTLPLNFDLGYSFFAFDTLGNPPIGEGTVYQDDPFVSNDLLDLSIFANDINFSDLTPEVGQVITITATVHNNSDYPAQNISVKFYEEDSFLVETFIPYLNGQSQTNVTISHVFPIDEYYPMKVVIDEDNFILEDNELNNFAIRPVLVGEFSIPGAIVATAYVAPSYVQPYNTVHWWGHADYVGSYDPNTNVSGAQVTMTIVETGYTYTTYTNSNGDFSIYFQAPSTVGTYHIAGEITDFTLLTNTNTVAFTVFIPETQVVEPIIGPDLAIIYWWGTDIHWTSNCKRIGDPIDVTAIVTNIGNATAYNALVHVFKDNNLLLNPVYDSIPAGTNKVINFTVSYNTVDHHSVSVDIDPYNSISELSEWNNYGSRTRWIYPLEPDLKPTNAWISDSSPLQGQPVNLTFRIDNLQCSTSDTTHADFYHIFGPDTTYIGSETVDNICSSCADYLYLYNLSYTAVGLHKILIDVDPENTVFETDESNNDLIIGFYVEQAIADLRISDLSFSAYNPNMGDLINFTATIWNNGTAAAANFYVRFYMDNGQIGDSILVPLLQPGINMLVTSPPWMVTECGHEISATVDEENLILETNEYNNYTERPVGYDFSPGLWPYYWSSYVSILSGTPITLKSRIYNHGTLDADTVFVTYRIRHLQPDNSYTYTLLGHDGVPFIHHQSHSSSSLITNFPYTGDYEIEIFADFLSPDSTRFCEINELNNKVILHIHVYGEDPDLQVLSQHISPTELNPDPAEFIDIFGSFTNEGNVPAGPFWVKFYANSIQLGDSIYVSGLLAHEDSTVACTAPYASTQIGTHVIRMELDVNHMVVETNEMNNMASRAIIVGDAPDHTFSDAGAGIWLSDTLPAVGDTIIINPIVENNGGASGIADLLLYYTFLGVNYPITSIPISTLPYDSIDVPFEWVVAVPNGRIYAEIVNANPEEFNIYNNLTYIDFGSAIDPLNIVVTATDNLICLGESVTINADPSGGLGGYIMTWTSNPPGFVSTGYSITVVPDETTSYTITADDGFYTANASTTIQVVDLALDLGPDLVLCGNDTAILDPGTYDTYLWQNQATTQTIVADDIGTYWVEVSMTNTGCTARDSLDVTMFPGIPTFTEPITICESPGQATLNPGSGYASYTWSTGAQTATIIADDSGPYYVTVTDQNGCVAVDTFLVTMYDMDVNLGNDTILCSGSSLLLDAGAGYDTYLWSSQNYTQTITVSTNGLYSVEATIGGCLYKDTIDVTFITSVTVDLGTSADLCVGDTMILNPGVFASYLWDNQSTNQTRVIDDGGIYSVTVTDQSGCTGTASIQVTHISVPDLDIADQLICEGDTFTYTVIGASDVEWSTGLLDQTIEITQAGTYSVTVYYGSCADLDTFTVSVVSMPLDLGPDQEICEGESVTLDAGSTFLSYNWSNGASSQSISVNEGDTYYVTVTGTNQCTAIDSVDIILHFNPVLQLNTTQYLCAGSFITLDAGTFASYLWSDQSTGQTFATSAAGNFAVTVTDVNGCTASTSVQVIETPLPVVDLGADTSICEGSQLVLSAGGSYTSYLWSNQSNNMAITVTIAGNYGLTVSDQFGCSGSDAILVSVIPLSVDLGDDIYLCPGTSATIDAGIYLSYVWSTLETSQSIVVTQAGVYSLTVSSLEGCTNSDDVEVFMAPIPVIDLGPDITFCDGSFHELYSAFFTTYAWSTGATSQSIVLTTPGTYSLTVTNSFGCPSSDAVDVSVYQLPAVSFSGLASSYCTNNDNAQLIGVPGGGTFTGSGVLNGYFEPYTLNADSYTITYSYTDINGCVNSASHSTVIYDVPNVSFTGLEIEYFSDAESDTLTGIPVGGTFGGNGMSNNIFDPVTAGIGTHIISYTFTDTNACTDTYVQSTLVSTVYDIYGYLKYDNVNEDPLGNSIVYLNSGSTALGINFTNAIGYFEFLDKHNGLYDVDVTTNYLPGGWNATDALKIRRHVVYLELLTDLKLASADVNSSNSITSADALLVLRRTVGLISTYPAGDWIFTDPAILISNADVNVEVLGLSFGDVDASYNFLQTKNQYDNNTLERSGKMLIEKGTTTRIPVFLKDINEAGAVTCIITYPDENIEIQSIDCDVEGYLFNVQNGEIKIAFENIEGVEIDNDQALFEIVATIKNSDIDNSKFRISSLSEVANKYGDIDYNARFNIPKLTSDKEEAGFYLEENYPNPFKITTTIAYSIPENGSVRLSVVNLLGEELELIVDEFKEAGKYSVEYDARGLSAGMYLYRLEVDGETRNFNASGTMQIIK